MKLRPIMFTFLFLCAYSLIAQPGTLEGTMVDEITGEPIMFGTIFIEETQEGTNSDLDGYYSIDLEPGHYTVEFSYLGYNSHMASDIVIVAGETFTYNLKLSENTEVVEEVTITAKQIRNTEIALSSLKNKSLNLLDGVSSQGFERAGDGNAADALKRVTGVSIEGGKHVFVRGLGDRYTKTILNGMDIPGLDPDRNSFEMDLLPTNLIENIIIYKSFSPDLPGDFTGGVLDVSTKDFPESKFMTLSVGAGYNNLYHFNDNFLRQEPSKTDWLGFDNGLRKNPINLQKNSIPDPVLKNPKLTEFTRSFKDNMGVYKKANTFDKSLSFSMGNKWGGNTKFSYILALNYKNDSEFYDDAQYNTYIYDRTATADYILRNDTKIYGQQGKMNTLLSGLVGFNIKLDKSNIGIQAIRIQNGTSQAAQQVNEKSESSSALLVREISEYTQREVTNINIKGKHVLAKSVLELSWSVAPTFIQVDEPDIRFAAFEKRDNGQYIIAPSVGADISRAWRNLKEQNYSSKVDLKWNISDDEKKPQAVKAGLLATYKNRDFGIISYVFRVNNQSSLDINGRAAHIFNKNHIWTPESNTGVYVKGGFEQANTFQAQQTIFAAYAMHEASITEKFKAIYGLRVEKADNYYTGSNNAGTITYDYENVLDELNLLPALNLIYKFTDKSNLRVSYSQTVARPSFKEKSIAQIQDRISGRTFIGNIDIKQSDISNFDLRYEHFWNRGQTVSLGTFYKIFKNPIELESYSENTPQDFTPKNIADRADLMGAEFQIIKNLGFVHSSLEPFVIGTNLTYVYSRVLRGNHETVPSDEKYRPMVGQSPFMINASISYRQPDNGIELNIIFNRQAKQLLIAGFGSNADIYSSPFNSLNFKGSKKFGKANRMKFSVGIDNILNSKKEKYYHSFADDTAIFESLAIGRSISAGFSMKL